MVKGAILSLFLMTSLYVAGQTNAGCEPVVISRLDSVVGYGWQGGVFVPSDVYIYRNSQIDLNRVIERLSISSRTPVNRQVYYDDERGLTTKYILQVWNGTEYINSTGTDYTYNPHGYLLQEVFSKYEGRTNSVTSSIFTIMTGKWLS